MNEGTMNTGEAEKGNITRRSFLKTCLGATAAGLLGGAGCGRSEEDPYSLRKPPVPGASGWYKGKEKWIMSTCAQCPAGCGIKIRVIEGRAVKIEGNTANPINRGGLGPKGQAGTQILYDQGRIRSPLKRVGERGAGKWKEISWDDAGKEVGETLERLRKEGKAHQLAVISGRPRGLMVDLWKRFCQGFGSPNFFDPFSTNDGPMKQAMSLMLGVDDLPANDWENCSYVLSLGTALYESTCQGIFFARLSALMRRGRLVQRSKLVHLEPSYSLTAYKADEWLPVRPGTYDAVALGIAHLLVKEGLYDREFVASHTFGFERWKDPQGRAHKGFKEILEGYPPEKVAEATGIPEKELIRLAHELAQYRPSLVVVDARSTRSSNGFEIARAALALNALLGGIDRPGGLLVQRTPPLQPWPELKLDEAAKAGLGHPRLDLAGQKKFPFSSSVMEVIPEMLLEGKPYPLQALFLYYANPLFTRIQPERFRKAVAKVPFLVSFSPFMDESALFSDLILPDHTYLERWEDGTPTPSIGYPVFGIRQPAVKPLYNTRHTGDFLMELARSVGGGESNFPWDDFKKALEDRVEGLQKSKKGSIVEGDQETFLKALKKAGFWEGSPYRFEGWKEIFKTSSGKFEFYSQKMKDGLERCARENGKPLHELLQEWRQPRDLDMVSLPHAHPPRWEGDPAHFSFYFIPYRPITYLEGKADLPSLQALQKIQEGVPLHWNSWVEISPEAGKKLGIQEGDLVWVESPAGKLKTRVKLVSGVAPDVAFMPLSRQKHPASPNSRMSEENLREILVAEVEPLSGIAPLSGTRVRIERA